MTLIRELSEPVLSVVRPYTCNLCLISNHTTGVYHLLVLLPQPKGQREGQTDRDPKPS
jgi:hypothetical protein